MQHKLLLADDSVTIQRVIELTFADEDVMVLTAGDGEQAIARILAERPDIVLADIGMPKRSGYDVAAFIKGDPGLAHVPVLLLAGAFEPIDEARAQAVRCDGVLVKPFEPQHVIARVRELLRDAPGPARLVSEVPRPADRLASSRPVERSSPTDGLDIEIEATNRPAVSRDPALDDYFDRLDAAIATMSATPAGRAPTPSAGEAARDAAAVAPEGGSGAPVLQMSGASGSSGPATYASPPSPVAWPAPAYAPQQPPIEQPDAPAQIAAAPPEPRRERGATTAAVESGSLIADAFSALLAVEQGEAAAPARVALVAGPPRITDDLIEEIARRVAERLGPAAVRDAVADVVRDVSERLVREEIARVKTRVGSTG